MSGVLRVGLLDSDLRVRGPASVLDQVEPLLRDLRAAPDGARERDVEVTGLDVVVDGATRWSAASAALLPEALLAALNATALEDCRSFAVHAGVVARGQDAVAWPGVSGAGKTTLVAACLQAGLDYVSDEALVLQDGRVRGYPKPLSLDAWSLRRLGLAPPVAGTDERAVPCGELGGRPAAGQPRLAHVVVLDRRAGAASLAPHRASGTAVLLLTHSFNHYRDPARAFRLATAAAGSARCWSLGYDDPAEGAELVARLLG